MTFRIVPAVALVSLVSLMVIACSTSDSALPGGGAAAGQGVAVTQTIGTGGGSVNAQGVVLTIPAGALPSNTAITITPSGSTIPTGYTGLSQLYTFAPDGTVFQKPVTIAFTQSSAGTSPTVYWSNAAGGFDAVDTTPTATGVSAQVQHFSRGFVGEKRNVVTAPADAGVVTAPDSGGAPSTDDAGADDAGTDDAGTDAGTGDAGTDASTADSGTDAAADAGAVSGISVTVDGTAMTFASNASVVASPNITTIKADDNASTTHWTIQIVMTGVPQEACQLNGNPYINYFHYTNGLEDALYTSKSASVGNCLIGLSKNPVVAGDHATGTFTGTVGVSNAPANSPPYHVFSLGSFDLTL